LVFALALLVLASASAMISTKVRSEAPILGSDLVGTNQQKKSGGVVVPELQENPSIPIPEGSQTTVAVIQSDQIIRTDIASKRKMDLGSQKPQIQTVFFNPNSGGSEAQAGKIKTTANISGSFQFGLTQSQLGAIKAQPFTQQEIEDLEALRQRLARLTPEQRKLKDKPKDVIQKKRAQELIARGIFDSTSVANKNFNLGLPASATASDIALARRQRMERDQILIKIAENKALNEQRVITGNQIIDTINKSSFNQKQFLLSQGIALRGQDLNPIAIAKLAERGLI